MDIILITKHFPYNRGETPGETFLNSEISVLAGIADRIYVIAVEAGREASPSIVLPANVFPAAIGSSGKYSTKLGGITGIAGRIIKPSAVLAEEKKRLSLKRRLYADYFDARAHQIADEAFAFLEGKELGGEILIYSYWLYYHAEAALILKGMLSCSKRSVKAFSRAHGYDLYEERKGGYLPFRKYLLSELDSIFPCSGNGTEYLNGRTGGVYSEKINTCYLGTTDHGPGRSSGGGRKVIASCSRIAPVKRVMRIAETLALMDMPLTWIHFGDGKGLDEIKQFCHGNLKGIDTIFTGNIPNEEILKYYSENPVDAFVNVSESEGLPISIMEALSFGVPVIATDVGGTSEVVIEGVTGTLLDKDFEDKVLARKIKNILSMSEDRYMEIRANCRRTWEENFMFEKNSRAMIEKVREK